MVGYIVDCYELGRKLRSLLEDNLSLTPEEATHRFSEVLQQIAKNRVQKTRKIPNHAINDLEKELFDNNVKLTLSLILVSLLHSINGISVRKILETLIIHVARAKNHLSRSYLHNISASAEINYEHIAMNETLIYFRATTRSWRLFIHSPRSLEDVPFPFPYELPVPCSCNNMRSYGKYSRSDWEKRRDIDCTLYRIRYLVNYNKYWTSRRHGGVVTAQIKKNVEDLEQEQNHLISIFCHNSKSSSSNSSSSNSSSSNSSSSNSSSSNSSSY